MRKICSKCNTEKDISEFYPNALYRDGYSSICKECQKESSINSSQRNREKIKKYNQRRYLRRKQEFEELKKLVEKNGLNKNDSKECEDCFKE